MATLKKDLHPNIDFFTADIQDITLKDEITSMAFPLFALKAGDATPRIFESKDARVGIHPNSFGAATIKDKDIWIFCVSHIMDLLNRGETVTAFEPVKFTPHDFLVSTNRSLNGRGHASILDALRRLKGTTIYTDVKTTSKESSRGFGLIGEYNLIMPNKNITGIEVDLPAWLWRAIEDNNVLTLDRDYFRISRLIDRRIYEIARKHCGNQRDWLVGLDLLKEKCVYRADKARFKWHLKNLAGENILPGYSLRLDAENNQLVVSRKPNPKSKTQNAKKKTSGVQAMHQFVEANKAATMGKSEAEVRKMMLRI